MKSKIGLLIGLLFLIGCAGKQGVKTPEPKQPTVHIVEGSDPVSEGLKAHIVARTDQFCKESGRSGVEEVVIRHFAEDRHTQVVYLCIGDPTTESEVRSSDVPFRVVDEEMDTGVISYFSTKAVICIYSTPKCYE